jgi:hypothetical protein
LFSKGIKRGEYGGKNPLSKTGEARRGFAPSKTIIPLPLVKGKRIKGIKGIGLIHNLQ